MAQDFGAPVQPVSEPKRSNTGLIIAIIVAVLLCCCCLVVVGVWLGYPFLEELWYSMMLSGTSLFSILR